MGDWTQEKAEALKNELSSLKNYILKLDPESYLSLVQLGEFEQLKDKDENNFVKKDAFIKFMKTLSGNVTNKVIKHYLDDDKNKKQVSIEDFKDVYRALLNEQEYQSEALTSDFNKSLSAQGGDRKHGLMGFESLKSFLENVQHCNSLKDKSDRRRLVDIMMLYRTR